MPKTATLTRKELHDRVWQTPMLQLAKEFGISDVGLAKICRRYDIPAPPRGYWAKKTHGKRVTTIALRTARDSTPEAITIMRTEAVTPVVRAVEPEAPELIAAREYEARPENLIVVPDRLHRRHPLVRRTEDYLKSAHANARGILDARYGCLDVSVSKAQILRAMRVMQALLTAFEKRGYALDVPPEKFDPSSTSQLRHPQVKIIGESIAFGTMERVKQTRNPAKRPSRPLEYSPAYLFEATGTLSLRSKTLYDGGRHRWADTPEMKIERRLNEFVVALVEVAIRDRARRVFRAEQDRIEAAAERRRYEEAQKVREFETEATAWQKSRQLRAYISGVERAAKRTGPIEAGSELDVWLSWAHSYASRIDPLYQDRDAENATTDDEEDVEDWEMP